MFGFHSAPYQVPSLVVLFTVFAWYLVEPAYFWEEYSLFQRDDIATAFFSVTLFLISYVVLCPPICAILRPRKRRPPTANVTADALANVAMASWLILLAIGVLRLKGDWISALFPLESRGTGQMWSRGAASAAGLEGFLVSTGAYLYILTLGALGLLLPLVRRARTRALLCVCILASWPYAFLQGSRSITLAIVCPMIISSLLYVRIPPFLKLLYSIFSFAAIEFAMRAIIAFRDLGFSEFSMARVNDARHNGLNMATELTYIVQFLREGTLSLRYGRSYFEEAVNWIPRALWAEKPYIGIDYSIARGFGGASTDIGVFATVSTGVIGQGVLNFGVYAGPIIVALLLAIWTGYLGRLNALSTPISRALFLVGLGLTFNLGRDITLLVLFPFVFGLLATRALERPRRIQ